MEKKERFLILFFIVFLVVLSISGCLEKQQEKELEPRFEFSDLNVEPKEITPGEEINVSVEIVNSGNRKGNKSVKLFLNAEMMDSKNISLGKNESITLNFELQPEKLGNNYVRILNLSETFTIKSVPEKIINLSLINETNKIVLEWEKIQKADYYKIYRNGEVIETVEEETFIDKENLEVNKTYTYRISVIEDEIEGPKSEEIIGSLLKPSPQIGENFSFTGNSSTETTSFSLKTGVVVFNLKHEGDMNFIVWLKNRETDKSVARIANKVGEYDGEKIFEITENSFVTPNEYYLDIRASGPWSLRMNQPKTNEGTKLPSNFTGKGDEVSKPINISKGSVELNITYNGTSNLFVALYSIDGQEKKLVTNEIGPYNGKEVIEVEEGIYYLEVTTKGPWRIRVN